MIGLHDRVELVKPGGTNRYGDPLPPTSLGLFPASVQPLSTDEKQVYGQSVTEDRVKVLLPALGLTIQTDWQIKIDGKTWHLHGNAETHRLNGRVHHLELVVKRST